MDNPNEKKPESTSMQISEENYKLLVGKIHSLEQRIDNQDKYIKDITSMNKELLNTTIAPQQHTSAEQRHAELDKLLKEGLHHA